MQEFDYSNWELFWATRPGLKVWEKEEFIPKGYQDIWIRANADAPWALQIMLFDVEHEQWLFKRDERIRVPFHAIYHQHSSGINYLKPKIQLLYKAREELRPKDQEDFDVSLPLLSSSSREWLLNALKKRFPKGHKWMDLLEN